MCGPLRVPPPRPIPWHTVHCCLLLSSRFAFRCLGLLVIDWWFRCDSFLQLFCSYWVDTQTPPEYHRPSLYSSIGPPSATMPAGVGDGECVGGRFMLDSLRAFAYVCLAWHGCLLLRPCGAAGESTAPSLLCVLRVKS